MFGSVHGRPALGSPWLAAGLLIALCATPAGARSHGISGYSGMNGGIYCGNTGLVGCHVTSGGESTPATPVVRFEGPTQLDLGGQGTYRFVVVSQAPAIQPRAGFDVAAKGGTLAIVDGEGEQILNREVTHTMPKAIAANAEAAWQFTWQAPTTPGVYVLFGAGNNVNFDTFETGDASAITTLMITVGSVAPTATPTATPLPARCAGDCNGNGTVTVNELIMAVNIALGALPSGNCPACDTNGDGAVSISELVAAVTKALNGC
jgi:hypothetical protein